MFQDQDARQGCYEICAYNSDENMVYGYGFDSTGQWFFMKSSGDRPFDVEYIKKLPVNEENDICAANDMESARQTTIRCQRRQRSGYGVATGYNGK